VIIKDIKNAEFDKNAIQRYIFFTQVIGVYCLKRITLH